MNWAQPLAERMNPGILSCQGCGAPVAVRMALKALGKKTYVVIPACCWTIIDGAYPGHALKAPLLHVAFETAAISAAGIRAALDVRGETDAHVMAWAGDGGTVDIGIQAMSGAAERNENIVYVCYDNEAYMNTGIQRSGATPLGAWTTTTPERHVKAEFKKDIVEIMAAHRVPYVATASISYPDDLYRKFREAARVKGFRFIHVLSPCPPGWRMPSERSIAVGRLAVRSRVFPLYEVRDGVRYSITVDPPPLPLVDYLRSQGRFKQLLKQPALVGELDRRLAAAYERIKALSAKGSRRPKRKRGTLARSAP